jgi:aspartyl-tRNA(Asn)/glutamyl-tRNA(Gln) amidotransferase subunit A
MSEDLPHTPLSILSQRLASGATTSREIVEACLTRTDALDGRLHAYVEVYRDEALAAAQAADLQRKAGFARGPLHGLPIALKDLLHIEGRATTAGSKSWRGRIATETATAVDRLLAAGMIPLGKTHMVEFAFGGWGRNQPMGAPWNPWDTRVHRVAGGSSSGSAVAVAAGLAPAAIGSDTGGSIRIPAALCGLTGLKPTYGTISLAGVVPLATTLDSLGPLARTVEDAALLTAAMAGPDPRDAATLNLPRLDFDAVLRGAPDARRLRITALPPEQLPPDTLPDVARALQQAIAVLRELGALVDEVTVPIDFEDLMVRNGRIIAAEAWALHRDYIEDPKLPIDPWVRKRTIGGKAISAADYIEELARRKRAAAAFAEWMRGRDILLTPTLPITATAVDEVDEVATPLATFTRVANYLGICGLSLPAGMSADGLPVAVQLLGSPFAEATLIRAGRAFQQATEWHLQRADLSAWESALPRARR